MPGKICIMKYGSNGHEPDKVSDFKENYEETTFVKFKRSRESEEIMRDQNCWSLLSQIAIRARRTNGFNYDGLEIGEALIGDYKSIGMTEQKYRTAKTKLEKYGFITTKPTNRGTVAKLINTSVFDINIDLGNGQNENKQRTGNEQVTTNNNVKNDNNINIIVEHLNKRCSTSYQSSTKKTQSLIRARIAEGFSVDDFFSVIDKKYDEWHGDPKFEKFLRPETLFGTKFESYLNQKSASIKKLGELVY